MLSNEGPSKYLWKIRIRKKQFLDLKNIAPNKFIIFIPFSINFLNYPHKTKVCRTLLGMQ